MLAGTTDSDPFIFTVSISAGSLLIGTLLGIWLNDRRRRRKDDAERKDPPL